MKRDIIQKSIIITGLANTGKTTLFNSLTGSYGLVSNYPMTTIEPQLEKYIFQGITYTIADIPGMNGLLANSEEELIFRKIVCETPPDIIIQCIDASRLKQSLYLTSELLYMNIPLVICLTSVDEAARNGKKVDSGLLSRILQIPVLEGSDSGKWGIYDVKEAVAKAEELKIHKIYPEAVENQLEEIQTLIPEFIGWKRLCAVLCMMDDPYISDSETVGSSSLFFGLSEEFRKNLNLKKSELLENTPGKSSVMIMKERGNWVDGIYARVVRNRENHKKPKFISGRVAYYSRHPVWGFVFLAIFVAATYFLVVDAAGWIAGLLDNLISVPVVGWLNSTISSPFWRDLLIGDYGVLTLGLFNAIITVLPILTVFFLLLGLLEDIGYLPNLSLLLRRSFNKLGLSGKAVMPIILGFGCKTMATMTTRNLKSRKERLIAIFLIAFALPCSAQLSMNMAILGNAGFLAFIIAVVILVLVEISAGAILNRILPNDNRQVFIQELPTFRAPSLAAIAKKTGYRVWWFLKEAIPIFVIAALVIFFIDLTGILDVAKQVLNPLVVQWLGLPIQMVDALILMLARQEAAAGLILRLSQDGMLNFSQSIIAVVVTTMFIPCFANIVAIFKEAGVKAGILMLLALNISTILLGGALNWVLQFAERVL